MSNVYVLNLHEVDQTKVAIVGGKGANLGELSRIQDLTVRPGFCITTAEFGRSLADASMDGRVQLSLLDRTTGMPFAHSARGRLFHRLGARSERFGRLPLSRSVWSSDAFIGQRLCSCPVHRRRRNLRADPRPRVGAP